MIRIDMDGGLIQGVSSDDEREIGTEVLILDWDVENLSDPNVKHGVPDSTGSLGPCYGRLETVGSAEGIIPDQLAALEQQGPLEGLQCPGCRRSDDLHVTITCSARLTAEGSEEEGDHDWDEDSTMTCGRCDQHGSVRSFRVPQRKGGESDGD